jgi:hypothetical protein
MDSGNPAPISRLAFAQRARRAPDLLFLLPYDPEDLLPA